MSGRSVIAVGNFDGVHRGHQVLFAEARRIAEAHREASGSRPGVVAVAFRAPPASVLNPGAEPPMILHADQRESALRASGADRVEWIDPQRALLQLEPRAFLELMVERYRPIAMVEGLNFRFGRGRRGGPENLPALAGAVGMQAKIVELDTVTLRDKTVVDVSSSLVRWLIGRGRMADVTLCLGRPMVLRGQVVAGEKRGRTIGYPTVNLDCGRQMLPCDGVYAGVARLGDGAYAAAVSIGRKPTFGKQSLVCEAHLLDFDAEVYGRTMDLALHRWLRDQRPFAGAEALRDQLGYDVSLVRKLWGAGLLNAAALAES